MGQGFPTIKWGDPSSMEDYQGGRDYDALNKFAKDNLKPVCSPSNIDLCDDAKKNEIADLQALPADELASKVEEKKMQRKLSKVRSRNCRRPTNSSRKIKMPPLLRS